MRPDGRSPRGIHGGVKALPVRLALLPTLLLLGACSQGTSAFIEEPENLPPASEAFLGTSVTVSGRLASFTEGQRLPISLTWPQDRVIGEVQPDGTFRATLEQPADQILRPIERQLWKGWSYSGEWEPGASCPVTSLRAEPAGVLGTEVSGFMVPLAPVVPVQPQTSPVPSPYRRLIPQGVGNPLHLVYVDRDVKVVGEQKCIKVYNAGTKHQYNVSANMTLRRGWNSVVRKSATDVIGGVTVYRTVLEAQKAPEPSAWMLVR